jgi:tripartite-type tricarboxylate transporter receptor subunit TctC
MVASAVLDLFRILIACTVVLAVPAHAQNYPSRPIKLVVAFAAGSGSDIIARILAEDLRKSLDQPVVVENKPGASAQIAADFVAKSAPDGYTLFLTTNTAHSANPFLFRKLNYDPVRDFTPIARVLYLPYVLVVRPDSRAQSVDELLRHARANPGKLNYGYGNSTSQVAGAAFVKRAGISAAAVPYKSMPPAVSDLLGGQLDFLFVDLTSAQGQLKAGQLKPLAFTLEKRSSQMPSVPAVAETPGLAGYEVTSWVGIVGPAGMPREIVMRLNAEANRTLAKPEIVARLGELGAEVVPSTPEEFAAFIARQLESWRTKIADAGIQPE